MTPSPPKIEYVIAMVKMPLIHTLTIHDLEWRLISKKKN